MLVCLMFCLLGGGLISGFGFGRRVFCCVVILCG